MNASARSRPLIIGIGNPLRSDDGLGWAVAEQLAQDGDTNCDIRTVHQLTPELAQWMAASDLVIMIDASHEGESGELHILQLSPLSVPPGAAGTHHMTPEELMAFTAVIYNHCPPVVVITLTGADFSVGEHLSSIIVQRLPLVRVAVLQACASLNGCASQKT